MDKIELGKVAEYITEKISVDDVNLEDYISTENMLPNKGGICMASNKPSTGKVTRYQKGDVLTSNIRPYFKKIWIADRDGGCSNDVLVIRSNPGYLSEFIYYVLSEDKFFDHSTSSSKGTKMPRGDKAAIMQYFVPKFAIDDQTKIVTMLRCIDQKIDVNYKLNVNLGELIQQIFDRSFADIDTFGKVSDLGYIQGGYAFKSKCLLDDKTNYRIIKIKNISGNSVDMINTQYVSEEVFESTNKKFILDDGEVVVAMTGAELGKTGIINNDDWITLLNQRVGVIRSDNKSYKHFLNILFLSASFQKKLNDMGYGSAQPNISSSDIQNIDIVRPNDNLLEEFYEETKDMYRKRVLIEKENRKLQHLRDILLPRFLSGEFR